MGRCITGFTTEQDVRLTLEAMEKRGWGWVGGQNPTEWNGWRKPSGDYSSFSLSYRDNFGQAMLDLDEDNINFREAIRELGGKFTSNTSALPEYFTIPCTSDNKKNPLWKKYIDWLNQEYGNENMGDSDDGFYGNHRNGDTYNYPYEMNGEPQITLEEWDSIVNSTAVSSLPEYFYIERDLPEYFYIERDLNDPRWMKFIDWINDTYGTSFIGKSYSYYGWDGYKGQKSCWNDVSQFNHNPTRITLDEWETITQGVSRNLQETTKYEELVDTYKQISNLPEYATESTVWHGDVSSKLTSKQLEEDILKPTTVDHTDPTTGIKAPEPVDTRLRTAVGTSSGNWPSTRVDGNDPLRMAHDAAMYGTAVSYATPTSTNDSIYESYRQAGKAHNARMNAWIDKQSIQGPTPSQVFIDEAPTKTSRYSSMLDLI